MTAASPRTRWRAASASSPSASGNDLQALAAMQKTPRRHSYDPSAFGRVTLPVLVLIGEGDTLVGPADKLAAAIPGAKFVMVPGDHLTAVGPALARGGGGVPGGGVARRKRVVAASTPSRIETARRAAAFSQTARRRPPTSRAAIAAIRSSARGRAGSPCRCRAAPCRRASRRSSSAARSPRRTACGRRSPTRKSIAAPRMPRRRSVTPAAKNAVASTSRTSR